jgi:hypothetical protein
MSHKSEAITLELEKMHLHRFEKRRFQLQQAASLHEKFYVKPWCLLLRNLVPPLSSCDIRQVVRIHKVFDRRMGYFGTCLARKHLTLLVVRLLTI